MVRFVLLCALAVFLAAPAARAAQTRSVTDMRGKAVAVPLDPRRVVAIDDGFVEAVMTHLGVIEKIAGVGSWGLKRDYAYRFSAANGETYEHRGWNTMKFLHPWLDDLPVVNSPQGNVVNFEALASAEPDLVVLRVGDCAVTAGNKEGAQKVMDMTESLGFPLITLYAPSCFEGGGVSSMKEEMRVLGELFGQREKAERLADSLAAVETMIRERTKDIPEEEKTRVLYLGLNPAVRNRGGSGSVWGAGTPEAYMVESVANAKNAYRDKGAGVPISAEQLYALDPDVIVLPTSNGYHPPRELLESSYYANLSELSAIKAGRVYAMPWTPMNCARRLEYPLDMLVIAKAAYPGRFADVNVRDFALQLYKDLYAVDDETAQGLASTQMLDWMIADDF